MSPDGCSIPIVDHCCCSEEEANDRFRRLVAAFGYEPAREIEMRNPDFQLRWEFHGECVRRKLGWRFWPG